MSEDKNVPITGDQLSEIIIDIFKQQKLENEGLEEDKKDYGPNSMIDKPLYRDDPFRVFIAKGVERINKLGGVPGRVKLNEGGDPYLDIDKELAVLSGMIGLTPSNSMEAYWIEEMKDRYNYLMQLKEKDKK